LHKQGNLNTLKSGTSRLLVILHTRQLKHAWWRANVMRSTARDLTIGAPCYLHVGFAVCCQEQCAAMSVSMLHGLYLNLHYTAMGLWRMHTGLPSS
jgi:hypothetical protein